MFFGMTSPNAPSGLYIHLGLHRTGSSALQDCLHLNKAAIEDAGLLVSVARRDGAGQNPVRLRMPGPGEFGKNLHRLAFRRDRALRKRGITAANCAILSEENLIGNMSAALRERPYRLAGRRLAFLAEGLNAPIRRVLIVVRGYGPFAASLYRKRCEFNLMPPFSDLADGFLRSSRGWVDLIEDIRVGLAPEEMVVLRHEDQTPPLSVARHLAPSLVELSLTPLERRVNASVPDAALEALQEAFRRDENLSHEDRLELIDAHAGRDGPSIASIPPSLSATLEDRYMRDLDVIAAMPGVQMPDPRPAT
ncbi:hypothetical protein [Litorisediminicola beolgyonensis]|uniref:Sulfotransferase family protein n=1 Tax=Litorisediminicola beolgyonensis TaxID=1173614 RepID=A0ABW3ZFE3_9RHOB